MVDKVSVYKLNLSGEIAIKDRVISEETARNIINLVMGGHIDDRGHERFQSTTTTNQVREDAHLTPKAFMAQKKPTSEMERMTCLAYYLTTYRDFKAFKTRDITKLNTEAAQSDFSNAAVFARNATQAQYLAKAGGGAKQITALGEEVVRALPDREAVKSAISSHKTSKKPRPRKRK